MKIALLNSFFPPDAAITGTSLAELVPYLRDRWPAAEICVFASAAGYRPTEGGALPGDTEVVRLGVPYGRGGALRRLYQSSMLGRRMAAEAVKWADVIVSLTDPPLLGFWVGRARAKARRPVRWIEWTMDLYPEAFAAAGLIRASNPLYRFIRRSQRRHPPDAWICLGEQQAKAVARMRGVGRKAVILPCGICGPPPEHAEPPAWRQAERRIVLAYGGNLGEAHCPELLGALVEAADPAKFVFHLALYGRYADGMRARLAGRANVAWRDSLNYDDLAAADVHIASLNPRWTHLCVPSKAVTTISLGRPLIYAGEAESDTANMFREAAWIVPSPAGGRYDPQAIRTILEQIEDRALLADKRAQALRLSASLNQAKQAAMQEIADLIFEARSACPSDIQ